MNFQELPIAWVALIAVVLLYVRHHFPLIVTYTLLHPDAKAPTRAYHKAACFDVYATADTVIPFRGWREVPTGVAFAPWPHIYIPFLKLSLTPLGNVAAKIHTRSGLARKKGLRAHLGIIDNDFRDEWTIVMFNHNPDHAIRIHKGDRVAQIEFYRVPATWMVHVKKLTKSLRGTNKFGSSGN